MAIPVRSSATSPRFDLFLADIESGFRTWSALPLQKRIEHVRRFRKVMAQNSEALAHAISRERCRPLAESLAQEVMPALEMAKYCEKNFPRWFAPQRISCLRPGFWRKRNTLHFEPRGPVAVITPRNFPFSLGIMSLVYLLLAGNTVLLKTSEHSHLVTPWIQVLLARAGLSKLGVAAAVSADGAMGEAVIGHPAVKKVFFFGSRSSGQRIAEHCIQYFKPFVLELGGGSSAFVCDDAALETTVSGLVWSSFYAGGQSCVSTERIFVEKGLAEKFLARFLEKTAMFERELEHSGKVGLYSEADVSRYRRCIEAACDRGGSVLTGGEARPVGNGRFHFDFTVISETAVEMRSAEEDVFGPLVICYPTENPEHLLRVAPQDRIGLGASIWTRNPRRAQLMARMIECGMIWINDASFGLPHLPWGGWGESGWGSLFSRFSLHEAAQTKWISAHPGKWAGKRPWWNPYTPKKARLFLQIARKLYG